MDLSSNPLQYHLLDLLIDGPSSFAALFGALRRFRHYGPDLSVNAALDALAAMERERWVRVQKMTEHAVFRYPTNEDRTEARERYRAWLPTAGSEDLSLDEVGLWYEIEFEGRRQWERWSEEERDDPRARWVLDDSAQSCVISIQAESAKIAEEALLGWLSSNAGIEIIEESKTIVPIHEFEMRDGTVITS